MNKLITMIKNKRIIVSTIFAIILLILGLFWLANNKSAPVQGSSEDYRIADGKVTNSKAGVSYNVPQGWTAEKLDYDQGSIMLYSSETDAKKTESGGIQLPLENGCLINTGIIYEDYSIEDMKIEALYLGDSMGASTSSFDSLVTGGIPSLKYAFESQKTGKVNVVYIPKDGRIASFALYLPTSGDQTKCLEDFGNFLGTVSIK
jgi:hypothetical protein